MKWTLVFAVLVVGAVSAPAQENLIPSRTLLQVGPMTSWGGDAGFSPANWGVSFRAFEYWDGKQTDGLYYSLLSGALLHVIDGNSLADLRVLNLGWRGNPFHAAGTVSPFDFSLDVGISPVVELRLKKQRLALGGGSVGLGGTLGLYFPVGEASDIGFSWEPVVDLGLWRWGSRYPDSTYADFVVYWVFKLAKESRNIPWTPSSGD